MDHHTHCRGPILDRRTTLLGAGALMFAGGSLGFSRAAAAATSPHKLVVINLRGGLDGLAAAAPYGDPYLARLRAPLMAPGVGKPGGMLDLGGFFGMHPSLINLHAMYVAGEAMVVHAVGNSVDTRSHFEAQDYLQSGAPTLLSSGWLNRALSQLSSPGGGVPAGMVIDANTPLLMRGPTSTGGWAPDPFPITPASTASLIASTAGADPLLGPAYGAGFAQRSVWQDVRQGGPTCPAAYGAMGQLAWAAGEFLASPGGPQVAALEASIFDTHSDQVNRLTTAMTCLDQVFSALKTSLGATWANTVVLTMTEFGRTAAANSAAGGGTDHGTGFAVFLAGGAVAGGRVMSRWPGLSPTQLFQGRDLAPTTDFRSIAGSLLQGHLGVSSGALGSIFPGATLETITGLLKV